MTSTAQVALPERRGRTLLAAIVAATCAWGALYIFRTSFVEGDVRFFTLWDDGMISMQYARNLALGNGLVWNAGESPVQGFSNPGVTLCMAAIHLLALPASKVSLIFQGLNLLLFATLVGLSARVSRRMFPDSGPVAPLAAALAVACCAPVAVWSLQGSDVGFVALCLLVGVDLLCGPVERCDRVLPWVAGLSVWIRPDLALFGGVLLVTSWLLPGPRVRPFAKGSTILLVAAAALLAGGQLYYGDPLPNTVYLKTTGSPRAEVLASGLRHLGESLPRLLPAILLAIFALYRARARRGAAAAIAAVGLCAAALAYNTWVGGDWLRLYESRFVAPTLPGLLIVAANGAALALHQGFPTLRASARAVALLITVVGVAWLGNAPQSNADWFEPSSSPMYRDKNQQHVRYGLYLREHSDPSASIGVYWGGVPPYFSERQAIDVLGKSDRHIARVAATKFRPGHSKYDWDYVVNERKPDIFLHATPSLKQRDDFQSAYFLARNAEIALYIRKQSVEKLRVPWLLLEDLATGEVLQRSSPVEAKPR